MCRVTQCAAVIGRRLGRPDPVAITTTYARADDVLLALWPWTVVTANSVYRHNGCTCEDGNSTNDG